MIFELDHPFGQLEVINSIDVDHNARFVLGSLLGFDKEGNVISLQMIGRLDATGLLPCTRNSDLYRMRIAESEGVMQIIRYGEERRPLWMPLPNSVYRTHSR